MMAARVAGVANTAVLHCLAIVSSSISLPAVSIAASNVDSVMQWLWFGLALRDGAARKSDMLSFLPVGNDLLLDLIVGCVCILVLPFVLFLERQRSPASLSDDGATDAKLNFMIHLRRY